MSTRLYARRGNTLPRERTHPPRTAFGTLPVWIGSIILWAILGYTVYTWLAVVS